jgi:hypothetical protein
MDLKAPAKPTRLGHRKDFIEGRRHVRIEIVQHQDDFVCGRIVFLSQPTDELGPFLFSPLPRCYSHALKTAPV